MNYVDDVVDALLLAAAKEASNGEICNLASDEPISLLDFVKLLIELNGGGRYSVIPFPEERKRIDIGDFYGDYSKIKGGLGWEPKTLLREGLSKTLAYYKEFKSAYWEEDA